MNGGMEGEMGEGMDGSFYQLTLLTFLPLIPVKSAVYLASFFPKFSTSTFTSLPRLCFGLPDFKKLRGVERRSCSHCCPLFHFSPFQPRSSPSPHPSLSCLLSSCLYLREVTAAEWSPWGNIFSISHMQWYVLAISHSPHHAGVLSAKLPTLFLQSKWWCSYPVLLKSLWEVTISS